MAQEIRLALVLNGGVSLAVWMGGVTHEINRVRMASSGVPPELEEEKAVHEAWRRILAKDGKRVVVDTVAGTSAGGLNGSVLATAIARGADTPDMKVAWSDLAALERHRLLRDDPEGASSVLSGTYFTKQVADLMGSIAPLTGLAPAECTLLVTATAINPHLSRTQLEGPLDAWTRDSRRVYRFRRTTNAAGAEVANDFLVPVVPPGSNDDDREAADPLSQAARASAGFPVAFEPVWEWPKLAGQRISGRPDAEPSWLMDGGVLDNAPFEPLIDALRERPVDAAFERVVLYVTPAVQGNAVQSSSASPPDVARTLGYVVGAIREPDQRDDMATLESCFEVMGYTRGTPYELIARYVRNCRARVAGAAPAPTVLGAAQSRSAADLLFPLYRAGRAEALERQLMARDTVPRLVAPTLLELQDRIDAMVPSAAEVQPGDWRYGNAAARRSLRWWGRALVALSADDPDFEPAFAALGFAQRRVADLDREFNQALGSLTGFTADQRFAAYSGAISALALPTTDYTILETFLTEITDVIGRNGPSAHDLVQLSADLEVLSSALAWTSGGVGDNLTFRYRQVTPEALPLVDVGPVGVGDDWPAKKLYGERWNHFGAFSTKAGRESDWLWGRLDGASALCELLVGSGFQSDPDCLALASAILTADGTEPSTLRERAALVYEADGRSLLRDLALNGAPGTDEADSIWLLVDTIPEVLGEIDGSVAGIPVGYLLESATARHLTDEDTEGIDRKAAIAGNILHWVAAPLRRWLRHKVKDGYEPQ